jgi:hypothetical protein
MITRRQARRAELETLPKVQLRIATHQAQLRWDAHRRELARLEREARGTSSHPPALTFAASAAALAL